MFINISKLVHYLLSLHLELYSLNHRLKLELKCLKLHTTVAFYLWMGFLFLSQGMHGEEVSDD